MVAATFPADTSARYRISGGARSNSQAWSLRRREITVAQALAQRWICHRLYVVEQLEAPLVVVPSVCLVDVTAELAKLREADLGAKTQSVCPRHAYPPTVLVVRATGHTIHHVSVAVPV